MKNIQNIHFGKNKIKELGNILNSCNSSMNGNNIFFIDHFFIDSDLAKNLPIENRDLLYFVNTVNEPTTDDVDNYSEIIKQESANPGVIIGIGGGSTLDVAKAVANLLTNGGKAEDYQGWDLVKNPGIYKIGIPTISGTGAEASRTCVMTNKKRKLKLGMNSDHTIFDELILDPELSATVERNQYFFTGLDTYIHCIESLNGSHRHPIADSFSHEALNLSKKVFSSSSDMMDYENREKLMVASYLGGTAIANSYVGVVHPLSAGLSIVLGIHHCIGNCIVMNKMEEFYPKETEEFHRYIEKNKIQLPSNITKNLKDEDFDSLYDSSIIHEVPLKNALGADYKKILTKEKIIEFYKQL